LLLIISISSKGVILELLIQVLSFQQLLNNSGNSKV
jgi:hypothetical protein